ncbi:MAG: LPS-assembly protein LptD [Rubrivivax sp.]|nr:LPS-assembly protein LptD [Rubrivivax sp.]
MPQPFPLSRQSTTRSRGPFRWRHVPWAVICLSAGLAQAQVAGGTGSASACAPAVGEPLRPVVRATAAAAAAAADPAPSPAAASTPLLRLDRELSPLPRGEASRALPAFVQARRVEVRPGKSLSAEGEVEFRRAGTVLRAERVDYLLPDDAAGAGAPGEAREGVLQARGDVTILRDGAVYRGPQLQLRLDSFVGWFDRPSFDFTQLGAGGSARRVEFLGGSRARALDARYTSCPREGEAEPAWQLITDRVDLDLQANEGIAEGAVLRFLGVPILAAPRLSFPISDERKSGWLPPSVNLDSRSGVDIAVPYYWNIAPHRDATITPRILARRGLGADLEFRYLEPRHAGSLGLDLLPYDRIVGDARYALRAEHEGSLPATLPLLAGAQVRWQGIRVSDDDWWKDFPRATLSITPRLLAQRASIEQPLNWGRVEGSWYARLAHWQVLQSSEAIVSPYQRSPQLGLSLRAPWQAGTELRLESELNHFTLSGRTAADASRPVGTRWHATASISRPWRGPGWWVLPSMTLNAAVYDTEGRPNATRALPTVSVDAGASFERETRFLGRPLLQVLEPRVRYVRTPFRDQTGLPNYDSAGKDFNFTSIYSDNAWSGVDRISDSHQLTLGATTRLLRRSDGAEVLRVGLVQRILIEPERVTPDDTNPVLDSSTPLARKPSDLLLIGSTQIVPRWTFEGAMRYNADTRRAVRSVMSARYNAGDFRTLSAAYRYTRGQAEQIDFGWQWPIVTVRPGASRAAGCGGRLYGVGRVNYSMLDSRITDSLLGLEYDAGCWIGRLVAERVSTGRTEATTRLMLQLELVGLSRLGSNPLKVLKDNIPGYRLLREP